MISTVLPIVKLRVLKYAYISAEKVNLKKWLKQTITEQRWSRVEMINKDYKRRTWKT